MPETAKRIVISINTSWNIFNFRAGLIDALVQKGFEVIAVAPQDNYSERLVDLGCQFIPLTMDNKGVSPKNDALLFFRYLRLFQRERPDVFLGYTIKPNVYGSLAAHIFGIPVINNVSGLGTAFIRENLLTKIVKFLYRIAFRRSAMVFFQNSEDQSLFLDNKLVRPDRTGLLAGSGINLEQFRPAGVSSPEPGKPFCFLLIARLVWDKGIKEYVDAAKLVQAIFPDTKFQLLGFLGVENRTAVDRDTVEAWVQEGFVDYLGTADDVRPFIAKCHSVVLPSYREGTPRTLLEAAAMGKPLIATDVPGCRDVVDDGRNGFLCHVKNAQDLAEKMLQLMALDFDERKKMGEASRKKVEQEFDEQKVIASYLEELDKIFAKDC